MTTIEFAVSMSLLFNGLHGLLWLFARNWALRMESRVDRVEKGELWITPEEAFRRMEKYDDA